MQKLIKLSNTHYIVIDDAEKAASKSAEITEQVAIEFGNFLFSKGKLSIVRDRLSSSRILLKIL